MEVERGESPLKQFCNCTIWIRPQSLRNCWSYFGFDGPRTAIRGVKRHMRARLWPAVAVSFGALLLFSTLFAWLVSREAARITVKTPEQLLT